jgi:GntR family transcriptional repressor for pyruvate dehydrogenase complex
VLTTASTTGPSPTRTVRPLKVAELLADSIRERILSGDLADGDRLLAQDDLLAEYKVGRPALREALRILENEGMLTVQRGNVGGAVVHRPTASTAAHALGMVLQIDRITLADVADALKLLEPLCVELCAGRPDRNETVVPILREIHEAGVAVEDDELEIIRRSRQFHEELAKGCGNDTLTLVVGALESLWSLHAEDLVDVSHVGLLSDRALRTKAEKEHARLIACIEQGDAPRAAREARKHLETAQRYTMLGEGDQTVRVIQRAGTRR